MDGVIVRYGLKRLKRRLENYDLHEICNAEESGLLYRMYPDKTIAKVNCSGSEKVKARFTFMPFTKSEESENIALKFICGAKKTRFFRSKTHSGI